MTTMVSPAPSQHDALEVIALGEQSWRVCDRFVPEDDATRLLAYVEQVGERFEVLWMWPRAGMCESFASLADALAAIDRRSASRPRGQIG